MINDLFDKISVLINCMLRKFSSITMIDIDAIEFTFIDELTAQKICDTIQIETIQLIKKRVIKTYDDKKN